MSKKSSFDKLRDKVVSGRDYYNLDQLNNSFVKAIAANAFKGRDIDHEPIYGKQGIIAHEILTRPQSEMTLFKSHDFNIGQISEDFYSAGLDIEFDALLCRNALETAIESAEKFPITLNISIKSALSQEFWNELDNILSVFQPEDIIWEVLEHDIAVDANISNLYDMRDQGYSFWLDDFTVTKPEAIPLLESSHRHRLSVLGDLVEGIKIDGPLVRSGLGDESSFTNQCFSNLVEHLKYQAPHAIIIAEHVQNKAEIDKLFKMGVSGVQGFNLTPELFTYTKSNDGNSPIIHLS